jgi:hypothetical protein
MIEVRCRTNLDLRGEQWPTELPAVPRVGERIQSKTKHNNNFRLQLEVCAMTWEYNEFSGNYVPNIELHMTSFHRGLPAKKEGAATGSMWAFYEWYAPLVGTTVHAFL